MNLRHPNRHESESSEGGVCVDIIKHERPLDDPPCERP